MFSLYRHIPRNWVPLTSQLKRIPQRRFLSEQKFERPEILDRQNKAKRPGEGKGPVSWVRMDIINVLSIYQIMLSIVIIWSVN